MKRLNMTRAATVSLAAALMAATLALAQPGAEDAIERGRELTEAFYAGDLASIAEAFSDELSDGIGGAEGLAAFREQVLAQLGEEVQVLDERVDELPGIGTYTRLARFERFGGPVMVQWALGEEGAIVGFLVQALPTSEPAPPATSSTRRGPTCACPSTASGSCSGAAGPSRRTTTRPRATSASRSTSPS